MKILISGSSGLIGTALDPYLTLNLDEVFKLVRTRANLLPNEIAWDLERGIINLDLLEGLDAVIHLAGENIADGLWTTEKKKRIQDSRIKGTLILSRALAKLRNPPKVLASASAIGYYGNRGDEILLEDSPKGTGFLSDVCAEWEAATQPALDKGIRVVNMRFGIVLSTKGGVLKKMLPPFKWGLGGQVGTGQQYMSWIVIDDLLRIIRHVIEDNTFQGPINVVSPEPVTNAEWTKILGKVLHRPTFLHLPEFMIRMLLGEMADEMLLSSTRAIPDILLQKGFKFNYPRLETALQFLLKS